METRPVILAVDDEKNVLDSLKFQIREVFRDQFSVETASNAMEALEVTQECLDSGREIVVVIADDQMPEMGGSELLIRLHQMIPSALKIMLTAHSNLESVKQVINHGALYHYISKPWESADLVITIKEAAQKYFREKIIEEKNQRIESLTLAMVTALETLNLYTQEETELHVRRVSQTSAFLAELAGKDPDYVRRIEIYSALHDIGKVAIPPYIWNKPGIFSESERIMMQQHVVLGAKMLSHPEIDPMAKNIALYHHEKWDGSGYVAGLKGEEIPFEARIVTLCDVFDALSSQKIYKNALDPVQGMRFMQNSREKYFDPFLLDLFLSNLDQIKVIREKC